MNQDLKRRWALVTGASSGLGVDFARELASRGCHLVLVARREDRLREVATELETRYHAKVEIEVADLGVRETPEILYQRLRARDRQIDILVNNAGFGVYGDFLEIPWEREHAMLELDIVTVVQLTKLFARDMVDRGFGRILQVASVGAYQATPTYASYSAAKSFVLLFSEAVHHELDGTGVTCTTVSPGITATEFLEVSGQRPTLYQRIFMMQSPQVATIAVRAMLRGRSSVVPGLANKLMAQSIRLTPRRLATAVAGVLMRNQ
jgi:hypothetical protein